MAAEDTAVGFAVEVLLGVLAGGVLYRLWGNVLPLPQRRVVLAFQQGVVMRGAKVHKVTGPGVFWLFGRDSLVVCDMRLRPFQVHGQELIAADGMGVRVSLGGEYRVDDPARFASESSDAFGTVYLEVRQALRAAVAECDSGSLLNGRALVAERVKELVVPRASLLGVELTHLEAWETVPLGWMHREHQ